MADPAPSKRPDDAGRAGWRFPILKGILPLGAARFSSEILAGATLASLAIPEVMGYTEIAGTPVITGLYTLLIPMALFALLGASRHLVVGADSATAAILAGGLAGMATTASPEYVGLAGLLAMMAAALLFVARAIRLGFLADFLSRTVLIGFLTGVGIQVAIGQIGGMLGISGGGHETLEKLAHTVSNLDRFSLPALAVSLGVLLVVLGARRLSPRIPGPLIAVMGAIAASWYFDLESQGLKVLGEVPSGLPEIALPKVDWSLSLLSGLLPTAFSIFLVILAQSAATSRAYAARYNERSDENQDLVGLGAANLGAAFCGSFVVNGSPTKTEMVDSAGGRTQLAQITTCTIVLAVLLFATGPLAYLPNAVLSVIVFLIGLKLIDVEGMRKVFVQARSEFWVASITAAAVVLVGVEQGILLAVALSLIDHTRRGYRARNSVVVANETGGWRARPVKDPGEYLPGLIVYRFSHSLYYANARQFSDEVETLVAQAPKPLRWFCVDAAAIADIDFSAAQVLRTTISRLSDQGIRVVFVMVTAHVHKELDRYGIPGMIGPDAFFSSGDDLIDAFKASAQSDAGDSPAPDTSG